MKVGNDECGVVLITGASRRIGASISKKFHAQGFKVIIHFNQSSAEVNHLCDELNADRPGSAAALQADLTCEQQVTTLAEQALKCFGALDVLVNNASGFYPTPFGSVTSSQWHDLMDSNLKAAFFLSQALSEPLKERNGTIVNLIDIYADKPLKNYSAYCIAKAGLQAMTRALAVELAPQVRVNGVSPGAILWVNDPASTQLDGKNEILKSTPLGKTGAPADIAEAVFFLAVKASYITGEILRVDGGRALNL